MSDADEAAIEAAFAAAVRAQPEWDMTPASERAEVLERAADLFESRMPELVAFCAREGGRTIPDSISEVREAVDFLRYYADRARAEFGPGVRLPGPDRREQRAALRGRGVFVCISPWNFPLAIFTGQIAAALAAGNAVIAKPAEQTPLIATRAVQYLLEAGVPPDVLHLLPGDGASVGARIVADPRVAGVAFTGSTETAKAINRSLANREGPIPVLIAETGGQNAMIVDSSALPEQVVLDAVQSGFNSAGQRCSALRVLFVQEEIAPRICGLLAGYMDELVIGDPLLLATDVGPVIDEASRDMLRAHAARIVKSSRWHHACKLGPEHERGLFFAPVAVEIESLSQLTREVFGPVVHVVRYSAHKLDAVIDAVNATGYGLTLGVHTRVDATARYIGFARARRQRLRQSQHDRRRGRRAAVRRPRSVGHRSEGGRSALPASLRHRADGDDQHGGGRRQREPADDGELDCFSSGSRARRRRRSTTPARSTPRSRTAACTRRRSACCRSSARWRCDRRTP